MRQPYFALLCLVATTACGGEHALDAADAGLDARVPDNAVALFSVPSPGEALPEGYFSHPYPSDLRLTSEGGIDLTGLPVPNAILGDYLDSVTLTQKGFGLTSAIYLRFDRPIDVASLPSDAIHSQIPAASVYLVNLNPDSPNYGRKLPIETQFREAGGLLIGDNWLGCLPFPGFVMEEGTTYGLVVTTRLLAENGSSVQASEAFQITMSNTPSSDPLLARAQDLYAPLGRYLDEAGGDERGDVVNAAVFTTQLATDLMGRFRRVIYEQFEAPVPRDLRWLVERKGYALYRGRFDSPLFQEGNYPYKTPENGGGFVIDAATGDPVIQGTNDLRFSMTIPTAFKMPEAGWPIVVYAHGTGGDYLTYERNGTAERMAALGIAVISIDQVMHGDRLSSGDAQTLFFNFQNPIATRSNVMQAALEDFQLVRLAAAFDVVERHKGGRTIRFDEDKLFFFGHSQGSVTGVPFASHEPLVKAAIFSGAGGLLYLTLLHKTAPYDVTAMLPLIIRDPEINRFHPALAMLQGFYEPADAIVYARLFWQAPPPGNPAKNVFQPQGLGDSYTPVPSIDALATAFGSDLLVPKLRDIDGLTLLDKAVLSAPVTGNAGEVTSIVAQYASAPGSDGHFVSFDIAAARRQTTMFIKTLVDTGQATVVAP